MAVSHDDKKVDDDHKGLNSLLAESHAEAIRTSFDGVQFNCFKDKWRLNLNTSCYLDRIYLTRFSQSEHIKIRLVLGDVAEKKSSQVARDVANLISSGSLSELSVDGIKEIVAVARSKNHSDVWLRQLKTFFLALGRRYSEYEYLVDEVRSYKISNSKPSVYDPEKGALTAFEHASLQKRLNEFSCSVLSRFHQEKPSYGLFVAFRQLINMRLLTNTVRRPVQLSMLKWHDIQLGMTSIQNEFAISMPSAKKFNARAFRLSFEDSAIPICETFSREIFHFKSFSYSYLSKVLMQEISDFSEEKMRPIFEFFPILPDTGLFTNPPSKRLEIPDRIENLKLLMNDKSSLFHVSSKGSITGNFDMLKEISSDRGVSVNSTLGCQRLRHTAGSLMAVKGFDNLSISGGLGNTPKAAKYYIDLLPESRVEINKSVAGLHILAKRFSGQLISSVTSEGGIYNDFGDICGDAGLITTCVDCIESRPIGCYGCDNFRPLIGADHNASLDQVKAFLNKRIEDGADQFTTAPIRNKIKDIEATIYACDLAKEKQMLDDS